MASNIVPPANFDASLVTFRAPKVLDSGAKQVYLDYEGRPLLTQTASMALPYGLNVYDKAGPTTYSVDLSFRGMEENPKIKAVYDMMVAFDERMIEAGMQNSQAWFKMASASREVIKAFYTPSVKISTDREGKPKPYPPTLKIKLPKRNGAFEAQFYDANKQPYEGVTVDELLVKGSKAVFLVRCTGLWFAGSKFGASWKAIQVKMDSVPAGLNRGCAILDDEDAPASAAPRRSAPARPAAPAAVDLGDEEEDEEEDVVEAALPPARAGRAAPAPAPVAAEEEDEEDVVEAPVVPKKAAAGVKKVVKKATK